MVLALCLVMLAALLASCNDSAEEDISDTEDTETTETTEETTEAPAVEPDAPSDGAGDTPPSEEPPAPVGELE